MLIADGAPLPFSSIGVQASGGQGAESAARACGDVAMARLPRWGARPVPRWKLFSETALGDAALSAHFLCHAQAAVFRHAWDAPGAYPRSRAWGAAGKGASSFVLHDGDTTGGLVLHPSAIEAATSAMEVVAVSARNAALLVLKHMEAKTKASARRAEGRGGALGADRKEEL